MLIATGLRTSHPQVCQRVLCLRRVHSQVKKDCGSAAPTHLAQQIDGLAAGKHLLSRDARDQEALGADRDDWAPAAPLRQVGGGWQLQQSASHTPARWLRCSDIHGGYRQGCCQISHESRTGACQRFLPPPPPPPPSSRRRLGAMAWRAGGPTRCVYRSCITGTYAAAVATSSVFYGLQPVCSLLARSNPAAASQLAIRGAIGALQLLKVRITSGTKLTAMEVSDGCTRDLGS